MRNTHKLLSVLIVWLLLFVPLAKAAVIVDQTGVEQTSNTVNHFSFTGLTVSPGLSNPAACFGAAWNNAVGSPAATWGTVSVPLIKLEKLTGVGSVALFCVVNPTPGNQKLNLTWTGNAVVEVSGVSFSGVNPAGGATSFAGANGKTAGSTGSISQAVASSNGDYTVGACVLGTDGTASINNTQIFVANVGGTSIQGAMAIAPATNSSVVYTCTNAPADFAGIVAVDVVSAAGGPPPPPPPVNGACGSANGVPVSSAPTTNLCSAGTASAVTGTGPWNWTCVGSNGGTTASCSAPVQSSGGGGGGGPLNLGMNFPGLSYFNNASPYADAFMASSGNNGRWDNAAGTGPAKLDATGAPTESASTNFPANYVGQMTLSWDGSGVITPDGACTAGTVTVSGSHHTQPVICPVVSSTTNGGSYQGQNGYTFFATPPVTNVHLTLPAANICGGMWNCDFINQTAQFTSFRYMDAMNTNADQTGLAINPVTNWVDRTWPIQGSRGGTNQGIAYEDVISLSNFTGKAAWINIPPLATDNYVCRLARLLAYGESGTGDNGSNCSPTAAPSPDETPLNANIVLYLESGNEPWNWGFLYTNALYCWANGKSQSSSPCPAGTIAPSTYVQQQMASPAFRNAFANDSYGAQATAQMLVTYRNKLIFRQVFTAAGKAAQPLHVLNTQSFNGSFNVSYIQSFMVPTYGEKPADVMAFAPYLSPSCPNADGGCTTDTTVAADYNDISTSYNDPNIGMKAEMTSDLQAAQSVGMLPAAYEGGVAWQQDNVTLLINATLDPQMNTWTTTYLNLWTQIMGSAVFNYYNLYSPWGGSGNWGAKANQADTCSQRWAAMMHLLNGPACTP